MGREQKEGGRGRGRPEGPPSSTQRVGDKQGRGKGRRVQRALGEPKKFQGGLKTHLALCWRQGQGLEGQGGRR